ncbi:hypothetical protein AHiyo6_11090 [Arthrobacter sp. Hiyo6]|nr:hypothetical protein AHiyo6_11090 [Arthrobacter sp. Hiyo6]
MPTYWVRGNTVRNAAARTPQGVPATFRPSSVTKTADKATAIRLGSRREISEKPNNRVQPNMRK